METEKVSLIKVMGYLLKWGSCLNTRFSAHVSRIKIQRLFKKRKRKNQKLMKLRFNFSYSACKLERITYWKWIVLYFEATLSNQKPLINKALSGVFRHRTRDRSRTGTVSHRCLRPARLPIPPPGHDLLKKY